MEFVAQQSLQRCYQNRFQSLNARPWQVHCEGGIPEWQNKDGRKDTIIYYQFVLLRTDKAQQNTRNIIIIIVATISQVLVGGWLPAHKWLVVGQPASYNICTYNNIE